MIITKAGRFKLIRFLGVFCAIVMGFMTLVATSEDDVTDAVDIDFDEDATLDLNSVTVNESVNTLSIQAVGDANCGSTSIDAALDAADIDDLDQVDIDSVTLNSIGGTYTASWLPDTVTSFTCSASISGAAGDITVAETAMNDVEGNLDNQLSAAEIDALNYYLDNRGEVFTYCVTCDDTELDSFTVTYDIEVNVTIEGEI